MLTGDTLFIGDVGRPDLLAVDRLDAPTSWLAGCTGRCTSKLLSLPDATRVFPAHGAGSACGKHLSDAVIHHRRAAATNYALRPMSEDAFVAAVTEGQPVAPLYFAFAADTNRREHDLLDDTDRAGAATADTVRQWRARDAVVSTPGTRRCSPPGISGVRSTSASTDGSPSTPATRPPRRARRRGRTTAASRGQGPVGSHRVRPGELAAWAIRFAVLPAAPRGGGAQLPALRRRAGDAAAPSFADLVVVDVRNPGGARATASSPVRSTSRWPG